MKFRTFITIGTVAIALMIVTGLAYAAEPQDPVVSNLAPEVAVITMNEEVVLTPETVAIQEISVLKKEHRAATNGLTKIFLRFKIRQLENQLNIKKALK